MVVFNQIWKNYDKIQLTKNKMDLNNKKIKNNPPYPGIHIWKEVYHTTLPQANIN